MILVNFLNFPSLVIFSSPQRRARLDLELYNMNADHEGSFWLL